MALAHTRCISLDRTDPGEIAAYWLLTHIANIRVMLIKRPSQKEIPIRRLALEGYELVCLRLRLC